MRVFEPQWEALAAGLGDVDELNESAMVYLPRFA